MESSRRPSNLQKEVAAPGSVTELCSAWGGHLPAVFLSRQGQETAAPLTPSPSAARPHFSFTPTTNYVPTRFLSPSYWRNWLPGFKKFGQSHVLISGKAGNRNPAVQLKAGLLMVSLPFRTFWYQHQPDRTLKVKWTFQFISMLTD